MRGNRWARRAGGGWLRSIPACAGEPFVRERRLSLPPVYPRLCGGTVFRPPPRPRWRGLSPPVRGNHRPRQPSQERPRSIPACAGEPRGRRHRGWRLGVYPRLCGGTVFDKAVSHPAVGLSPPVRGNQLPDDGGVYLARSIPACAGEPAAYPGRNKTGKVYPRLCGGTWRGCRRGAKSGGLSPPVRGNLINRVGHLGFQRSIPACAGEPIQPAPAEPDQRVYPRLCGGTSKPSRNTFTKDGLSPPVRGNQRPLQRVLFRLGSIPACAGEPP